MKKYSKLKEVMELIEKSKQYTTPSEEEAEKQYISIYSEDFNKQIKIKNVGKPNYKVAGIIAFIIISILGSMTVYAIYKAFEQRENDNNTDIIGIKPATVTTIEEIYLPVMLPAGYILTDSFHNEDFSRTEYKCPGKQEIYVSQLLYSDSTLQSFDNEDTEEELLSLHGAEAFYSTKHGESTLVFYCEGYAFIIDTAEPTINKELLVSIANSMKKTEEENENE